MPRTIGPALEIDTAMPIRPMKSRAIGPAIEIDTAMPINPALTAAVAVVEAIAGYPERVQEAIVAAARALLELFTSDAIVSMWSITDPTARIFLILLVAVLIDRAWSAAFRRT